jgi:hypothetical protein
MMDSLKTLFFESHLTCCVEHIIADIKAFELPARVVIGAGLIPEAKQQY